MVLPDSVDHAQCVGGVVLSGRIAAEKDRGWARIGGFILDWGVGKTENQAIG
jgi:hypothetical protein